MATETMTRPAGPKIVTKLPGPNAQRVLKGDEKWVSPSYTRSYPLVAKRGRGVVVEDVDGNEFFDMSAGIAVTCMTCASHKATLAGCHLPPSQVRPSLFGGD